MLCSLTACVAFSGSHSGQVQDIESGEPISDAYVFLYWDGRISAFVDSRTVCMHAEATITDSQGKYKTKIWSKVSTHGEMMTSNGPNVEVYKQGYSIANTSIDALKMYGQGTLLIKRYKGTNQERLQYLLELSSRVQCFGTNEEPLFQMRRAIYREAKGLAASDQDKLKVQALRASAAEAWLGPDPNGFSRGVYAIEALIEKNNYLKEELK